MRNQIMLFLCLFCAIAVNAQTKPAKKALSNVASDTTGGSGKDTLLLKKANKSGKKVYKYEQQKTSTMRVDTTLRLSNQHPAKTAPLKPKKN